MYLFWPYDYQTLQSTWGGRIQSYCIIPFRYRSTTCDREDLTDRPPGSCWLVLRNTLWNVEPSVRGPERRHRHFLRPPKTPIVVCSPTHSSSCNVPRRVSLAIGGGDTRVNGRGEDGFWRLRVDMSQIGPATVRRGWASVTHLRFCHRHTSQLLCTVGRVGQHGDFSSSD